MSQSNTSHETARGRPLKAGHVLVIFLGFFGLMFAVNGIFLYSAITSFPGEDVKNSYLQGIGYNATLAERQAQRVLGWTAEAGVTADMAELRLRDAAGRPVSGVIVSGTLRHPSDAARDLRLEFTERGNGRYFAKVGPLLGTRKWTLQVEARDATASGAIFVAKKRMVLQ